MSYYFENIFAQAPSFIQTVEEINSSQWLCIITTSESQLPDNMTVNLFWLEVLKGIYYDVFCYLILAEKASHSNADFYKENDENLCPRRSAISRIQQIFIPHSR